MVCGRGNISCRDFLIIYHTFPELYPWDSMLHNVQHHSSHMLRITVVVIGHTPLPAGLFALLVTECNKYNDIQERAKEECYLGNSRIKKWRSNEKEIDSKDHEKPENNDPPLPRRGCPPPPIELTLKPKTFGVILKIRTVFFKHIHDDVMRRLRLSHACTVNRNLQF